MEGMIAGRTALVGTLPPGAGRPRSKELHVSASRAGDAGESAVGSSERRSNFPQYTSQYRQTTANGTGRSPGIQSDKPQKIIKIRVGNQGIVRAHARSAPMLFWANTR